jgi:hypothetical protein
MRLWSDRRRPTHSFGFVCFRRAQEEGQTGKLSQECASGHNWFSSIETLAGTMRRLYSPFAAVAK